MLDQLDLLDLLDFNWGQCNQCNVTLVIFCIVELTVVILEIKMVLTE